MALRYLIEVFLDYGSFPQAAKAVRLTSINADEVRHEILADLEPLTETEIEQDGKGLLARFTPFLPASLAP